METIPAKMMTVITMAGRRVIIIQPTADKLEAEFKKRGLETKDVRYCLISDVMIQNYEMEDRHEIIQSAR
jgi:hypothetical protein